MLVLSRQLGEQIRIGDDIVITVVRLGNGAVRLGIDAPKHVKILRDVHVPPLEQEVRLARIRGGSDAAS